METLRQLLYYLEDSARIWFESHKNSLEYWNDVKSQFLVTLTMVVRKERAEVLLETRTQHPNESVVVFAGEMARLLRRADPCMAEEKKLRFLMRCVREDLFAGIVRNPPKTAAEFVTEASTIEKALERRAKQYNGNLASSANAKYVGSMRIPADSLRETIRDIVGEERRKRLPTAPEPQVASLTDVIREEVQQVLGTSTTPEAPLEPQAMATWLLSADLAHLHPYVVQAGNLFPSHTHLTSPYRPEAPYRRPLSPGSL